MKTNPELFTPHMATNRKLGVAVPLLEDLRGLARGAHRNTSFSPEKRGDQIISDYSAELESDIASMPVEDADQYLQKYMRLMRVWLVSLSGCASPMITGPAKFPVERMRKRSEWADNHYNVFREWRSSALKAIVRKVEKNRTPEEVINDRWKIVSKSMADSAQIIVGIDMGLEKGYSRRLFVNSITRVIECSAKNGETEIVKRALHLLRSLNTLTRKGIVSEAHAVWNLETAATVAAEQKVDTKAKDNSEYSLNGIRVITNYQEDRVQLVFNDKAHAMKHHDELKGSAWNWSHKNQAWQRKLTGNAQYSALKIIAGVPLGSFKSEVNGKHILTAIVKSVEEANSFTARNPQWGVLGEDHYGIHIARNSDTGT